MFNWQDDKSRLNSVIELDYNSGNGLKVNDVASNVGQGWNLLQGGVITRLQAGEPDDQPARNGDNTIEDVTKYPAGFLYSNTPYFNSPGCPTTLTEYPIFGDKNHIYKQHNVVSEDRQIDYFSFIFNGRSGMFALDKVSFGNNAYKAVLIGDSKLNVWYTLNDMTSDGIRTTIDVFYIQDENGLIYKFSQHDITQTLKTQYCDSRLNATYIQPKLKSGKVAYECSFPDSHIVNPKIINGWHLTEIRDPLTNRTITFTYTTENIHADNGTAISYYDFPKNYSIVSHLFSYSVSPKINSIIYPDGHLVLFNYGAQRIDMIGDNVLSSIDIKYQNRFISKYLLNTTYIIKNRYGKPNSDFEKQCARLYLRSVTKIGVDLKAEENPYVFDYFLGSSTSDDFVPPPFFHLKDIWGYYNGSNSEEVNHTPLDVNTPLNALSNVQLKGLCFLRDGVQGIVSNPKRGYAKNGLLRQITYPTGGSLNYDYDQNQFFVSSQNVFTGGVHVIKTTLTDGGYSNDCNHPVVTNYNYSLDNDNMQSSLTGGETPLNSMTIKNHYSPKKKYFDLLSIGCKYHFQYPGILSRDQAVSLTTGQEILVIASNLASIAGTVSEVVDIIQLCAGTTGPAAVIIDVITTIINAGLSCFLDPSKDNSTTIYYNSDLNSSNPLPAQFKRLQVVENSGSNGKTVYDFTSSDDYNFWVPANTNLSLSMKQRFPIWAYGLIKKVTKYDAAGINPIQQTENIYDPQYLKENILYKGIQLLQSCKCLVTASTSQTSDEWVKPERYNAPDYGSIVYTTKDLTNEKMKVDPYNIYTGRLPLQASYERIFKPGSSTQFLETEIQYEYNNNYQVSSITTTLSNGDKNYKTIDYDNSLLTTHNIIATPVETTTSYMKNNSSIKYYTGESVTEYTTISNGNIVPSGTLVKRFTSPVLLAPFNSAPYTETQTLSYDLNNNLNAFKDEGGHSVTNIYDYNDKYVTASVINADPSADKAAYSSFETTDFSRSGWTLTGVPVYNAASAVTGSSSLTLSPGKTITALLSTSKPYRLSFWASASLTISSGATLINSAPIINGFTYYEYNIAQGISTVTVSGTGNIDELRLYPQNARMRTVTYDPLIGKTSECDENNRITYYEYDELGRLRFIKDENKSIVKMYEYNLKSKVNGCPSIYHNLAVTEIFTPNNCGTGYIGKDYVYNIPDSKYISTISQDDVDQKVQAELDVLGQSTANNASGYCIKIWTNDPLSQTFTKEGCDPGYKGTTYTYSVPGGRFISTVSKPDANDMAQEDIDANGQALANLPVNGSCTIDNTPHYVGEENAPTQCQVVNGSNTGHQLILVTDVNPNSSTYNHTQWADMGENIAACPVAATVYAKLSTENIVDDPNFPYDRHEDIIVRFYSDYNCTTPLYVSNLTLNYVITTNDTYYHVYTQTPQYIVCNGTSTSLGTQVLTYHNYVQDYEYNVTYGLSSGSYQVR
jgi:hypothetical protein